MKSSPSTVLKKSLPLSKASNVTPKKSDKNLSNNLAATSTLSDLRKLMESETFEHKEAMRDCIRRAAILASRSNSPHESFVGINNHTYPEVAKAFSAHSGVRPCQRCKGNKQGVS